jgi:hypothetical protein
MDADANADAVLRISASASTSNGMNANQSPPMLSLLRYSRVNEDKRTSSSRRGRKQKEGEERTALGQRLS